MVAQREWFEKDYYAVLGVSSTAPSKEITKAYRKLARSHHPDAKGGNEERFKEVSAAYDVLGDESKRGEYDEARRLGERVHDGRLASVLRAGQGGVRLRQGPALQGLRDVRRLLANEVG